MDSNSVSSSIKIPNPELTTLESKNCKLKLYELYDYMKPLGLKFNESDFYKKKKEIDVKLPAGWGIFGDSDLDVDGLFYIINSRKEIVARINIDYRTKEKKGKLLIDPTKLNKEIEKLPFSVTYPFPSFYVIDDDGYLVQDPESDVVKLSNFLEIFSYRYSNYLQTGDSNDRELIESLKELKDQIESFQEKIPDWFSYKEITAYINYLPLNAKLAITSEEIEKYLTDLYLELKSVCEQENPCYCDIKDMSNFLIREYESYRNFIIIKKKLHFLEFHDGDKRKCTVMPLPEDPKEIFSLKTGKEVQNGQLLFELNELIIQYGEISRISSGPKKWVQKDLDEEYEKIIKFQKDHQNVSGVSDKKIIRFVM